MPSVEVTDVTDVDMSKLISYTMSFEPLQLVFASMMKRMDAMETAKAQQDAEIDDLKRALHDLQQRESASSDKPLSAGTPTDLRELWEEVERLKRLLGQARDTERRRTIEELYAARRRKESSTSLSPGVSVGRPRQTPTQDPPKPLQGTEEAKIGDVILHRAQETLPGLPETPPRPPAESPLEAEAGEEVQPPRVSPPPSASHSSIPAAGTPHAMASLVHGGEEMPSAFPSEWPQPTSSTSSAGPARSPPGGAPQSVHERLQKDGADIEHLNRVVAEMLNEMKGLHDDVDLIRTVRLESEESAPPAASGSKGERGLAPRVAALEAAVEELRRRVPSLGASGATMPGSSLPPSAAKATALSAQDAEWLRGVPQLHGDAARLRDRVGALEAAQSRTNEKLAAFLQPSAAPASGGGVAEGRDAAQVALLAATVGALEKQLAALQGMGLRNCDDDLRALREALAKLQAEVADLAERVPGPSASAAASPTPPGSRKRTPSPLPPSAVADVTDVTAALEELLRRTDDLARRVTDTEGGIKYLDEEKADRASLQRLSDDLQQLRQLLELGAGSHGEGDAMGATAAMQDELRRVQTQLTEQLQESSRTRDAASGELDDLRALVEQLNHRKADATLVANKAERDYVENALERLMREVEQVLNATNAGLIDTLDRSLNVLRDMLEGKATKQDMAQLQRVLSEESSAAGAPDALTGFKGFRCLGCNRTVENMRPRVMANRLQPFVNRLPQNNQNETTARIQQNPSIGQETVGGGGSA